MQDDSILILSGDDVLSVLAGREIEIMQIVEQAYKSHAQGNSSLPHSTFLRFPGEPLNRIIALPAFLGGDFQTSGMKWIASFPANREAGLERASAVLILNSTTTGRPLAIIEGSRISAKRTAASAVLAARRLHDWSGATCVGLIGCGLINLEVARFILADRPETNSLVIFDTDIERARQFRKQASVLRGEIDVRVADDVESILSGCSLVSIATTAIEPHISDLSSCAPGTTILHVSLRDLTPQVILSCDNVVDDIDHVCRAQTSVHLAELQRGNRDFIRCTLGDVLLGAPARPAANAKLIFSPFGLGILDLAVAKVVLDIAKEHGRGSAIHSFLPGSWTCRQEGVTAVGPEAPGLSSTTIAHLERY
jgi:ornithine cyclodeaminase